MYLYLRMLCLKKYLVMILDRRGNTIVLYNWTRSVTYAQLETLLHSLGKKETKSYLMVLPFCEKDLKVYISISHGQRSLEG